MKKMKKKYIKPRVTVIETYSEESMMDDVSSTSASEVGFKNRLNALDDAPGIVNGDGINSGVTDVRGNRFLDGWDDWDE